MFAKSTLTGSLALVMLGAVMAITSSPTLSAADAAFPLEGTRWRVTDYGSRDAMRSAGPEVAARIALTGGKLHGSDGCSTINGRYATVGAAIAIEVAEPRVRICPEQTALVAVGVRDGMAKAATYELTSPAESTQAELVLKDGSGFEVLRFELDDIGSLTHGEWRLEAYTMGTEWIPADPVQAAVLSFRAKREDSARRRSDGATFGSTGCNGLVADYRQLGSVIRLGELQVSDAPCTPTAQAQQAAIIKVLESTRLVIELPADRLLLSADDSGERLEFVTATPLEGSTWLLTRLPGSRGSGDSVTLRLVEGALSGEGPCGAYSGRYETNGVLLQFSELSGAATEGCRQVRRQRQLLSALRSTVLVDNTTPRLRLFDAFGRVTATFRQPGGP